MTAEKLTALIPPPRLNLVRYHGILAPNARHRSQVVPAPPSPPVSPTPGVSLAASTGPPRIAWAALLARVFALDVTRCPACGGRLRLIAALTNPASIRRYLHGVELPTQPPPLNPPRPPLLLGWGPRWIKHHATSHRPTFSLRRRRIASKYAYPPTRCIENPLFRPASPQLSSTGWPLPKKEAPKAALPDDNGPSTRPNRLTQNLKRPL